MKNVLRLLVSKRIIALVAFLIIVVVNNGIGINQYISTIKRKESAHDIRENCDTIRNELRSEKAEEGVADILRKIRICRQDERIDYMKKVCQRRFDVSRPEFLKPSIRSLIDYKNNLTFCWMSKAGGTSLKAFILEANGLDLTKYNKTDNLNLVHFLNTVNKYGLQQMLQLNSTDRQSIVEKFVNVMAIRHPFDRLVAYYRDKIVDTDRYSNHPQRAAEILKEFRSEYFMRNKTLSEMKWPQEVLGVPTFKEVMTWIYRHKVMDEHWNFIYETCHPCAHDWRAILRVETMDTDGRLLAKLVRSNHSQVPVRHSHQAKASYLQFGKTLDQFADVPEEIIDYFLEFYRTDMEMFGYRWDKETHTAYCAIKTDDGWCC